jgi:hypothetical protein
MAATDFEMARVRLLEAARRLPVTGNEVALLRAALAYVLAWLDERIAAAEKEPEGRE